MILRHTKQSGFTFIEVLVGMAVGVIVIGGAVTIYTSSVRGGNEILLASKLNQEVGALMHVIINDVRRAGYWGELITGVADENPFNQAGATTLVVRDDMTSNALQGPTGQGSCLTYAYDATYLPGNISGTIENADLFGFRLNGTTVQMRQSGTVDGANCIGGTCSSCTNGNWLDVTDSNVVEVTQLTFDLSNSQCLNSSEPNDEDDNADGTIDEAAEQDCYVTIPPAGSGEVTLESIEVTITINARLASDPQTQTSATNSTRARNSVLRIR